MAKPVDVSVSLRWKNAGLPPPARTAALFKNGTNQAVRLPQDMRFPESVKEVTIRREGDRLVIAPVPAKGGWTSFFANQVDVPEDFMADRDRTPPQAREGF